MCSFPLLHLWTGENKIIPNIILAVFVQQTQKKCSSDFPDESNHGGIEKEDTWKWLHQIHFTSIEGLFISSDKPTLNGNQFSEELMLLYSAISKYLACHVCYVCYPAKQGFYIPAWCRLMLSWMQTYLLKTLIISG